MQLLRIPCPPFARAKDLTVSPSYVVGCTGRKAVILDRQYNLLQTVDGLDYVYKALLSPDEKQLLLISNVNRFYVSDLASGTTRKVTLHAPFHYNLEGQGCWSGDGRFVYIPVSRGSQSILRRYCVDDLTVDAELLPEEFHLTNLHPLDGEDGIFMVGWKQESAQHSFLFLKNDHVTSIPLKEENGIFFQGYMQLKAREVHFYSAKGYLRFSLDGTLLERVLFPFPSTKSPLQSTITKYALSACGNYIFLSSDSGFYLLDAATKKILAHHPEEFGVHNFEQLETDVIALATWGGVKLFRMM